MDLFISRNVGADSTSTTIATKTKERKKDKKFWLDASDRLMYEGKAPEFSDTQRARVPAFFEHSNVNLPQYA